MYATSERNGPANGAAQLLAAAVGEQVVDDAHRLVLERVEHVLVVVEHSRDHELEDRAGGAHRHLLQRRGHSGEQCGGVTASGRPCPSTATAPGSARISS